MRWTPLLVPLLLLVPPVSSGAAPAPAYRLYLPVAGDLVEAGVAPAVVVIRTPILTPTATPTASPTGTPTPTPTTSPTHTPQRVVVGAPAPMGGGVVVPVAPPEPAAEVAPPPPPPPTTTPVVVPSDTALYVLYGQSNAAGYGARPQGYTGPPGRAFVWRGRWDVLSDPMNGPPGGGSWVPRGGPVAFLPEAHASTAIVDLTDGSPFYARLVADARARNLPVRAVLYWQGETDAVNGTDEATYRARLAALALALDRDLGAPLVVAQMGPESGALPAAVDAIRVAQRACWTACSNVVPGPSFADMTLANGGDHVGTDDELTLAGDRWYDALAVAFAPPIPTATPTPTATTTGTATTTPSGTASATTTPTPTATP
jgi:hypothetical protein